LPLPEDIKEFASLVDIIARLRSPEGCPWDRKQTHRSLRPDFLEECYEVLEALDEGDTVKLRQELGDLLLHIFLQAQIAGEAGEFGLSDVMKGISQKLVYRHPHVFGSAGAKSAEEVAYDWEALKRDERGKEDSLLASVPRNMPALSYSQEVQQRAATVGFDWKDVDGVIEKLAEEVGELKQVEDRQEQAREFGDMLFALANAARWMKIDLETALREANKKFYRRFAYMEQVCRERGLELGKLSFEEQNALWEEAKKKV
jgi:tetrapyrrole methylase family protein / MazG family protein